MRALILFLILSVPAMGQQRTIATLPDGTRIVIEDRVPPQLLPKAVPVREVPVIREVPIYRQVPVYYYQVAPVRAAPAMMMYEARQQPRRGPVRRAIRGFFGLPY